MEQSKYRAERIREDELFKRREDIKPHSSYSSEKIRYQLIEHGRVEELDKVMKNPEDGSPGRLSTNELRHHKNMLISAITLYTRAAMDGGLPEETAYAMSDGYILSSEQCTTVAEVEQLNEAAIREFTQAVAEKGNRHYSVLIENAIHYIHIHLHEQITLQKAADNIGISACHLSRIFKKETGLSIVDYIQEERIAAAKNMLIYSNYTTAAVSEYLHFSTQSYFIRIFKKYVGVTPEYFRKHYKEEAQW